MTEYTYVIAVDALMPEDDIARVKNFIMSSPDILNWWNYIPYVFIVVSALSAEALNEKIKPITRESRLLIVEAELRNSDGWLAGRAWDWIKRRYRRPTVGALTQHAQQS